MSEAAEYGVYLACQCVMDVFYVFCNIHKNVLRNIFQNLTEFSKFGQVQNYLSD